MNLEIEPIIWKKRFKKMFGHNPKVLLIGNVANNAYQFAKLLNRKKIECDVLCNDYYHIMGSPEWEDTDVIGKIQNQEYPDFGAVNLHGYKRPKWFAQGPLLDAIDYLIKRRKSKWSGFFAWQKLDKIRKYVIKSNGELPPESKLKNCKVAEVDYREYWKKKLTEDWASCFPDRNPIEWTPVCDMFLNTGYTIQPLLSQYDIIVAFGGSVWLPYFAGCEKYVAFEHGTLRPFRESNSEVDNLTMLAYAKSSVLINTNTDCYDAAEYITSHSDAIHFCGLHGIGMSELMERLEAHNRMQLRDRLGIGQNTPIIFFPARHTYETENGRYFKGDEKIHTALRYLVNDGVAFVAVMVDWGSDVARFKEEIERDDYLKEHIRWIEPLFKRDFIDAVYSSDVVLDQFTHAVFGAIAIETMMANRAILVSHSIDKKIMEKFFSSTWPVLEADSADEIKERIESVIRDKSKAREVANKQFQWVCKEHSAERIASLFCGALMLSVDGE